MIPVHNALEYLQLCVDSLRQTLAPGMEVIFVNDASQPETAQFVREQASWSTCIRNDQNQGFSSACNRGASMAKGEWIFFANSDLVFPRGWANSLLGILNSRKGKNAYGFKLLYPDQTIQHAGVITLFDDENLIPFGAYSLNVGDPSSAVTQELELDVVTAAAFCVRKADFDAVGGFEEAFFNGGEDIDLCLRLRQSGVRIWMNPSVSFTHYESKSGPNRWLKTLPNQRRLAEKWVGKIRPNAMVNASFGLDLVPENWNWPNTNPKTTVIFWTRNHLAHIAESSEALRSNLGLFHEAIMVDVGSSDGTREYLELFDNADPRIRFQFSDSDWSSAIAKALESVRTENVVFLEAGSFVSAGWIRRLERALSGNSIASAPVFDQIDGPQNVGAYAPPQAAQVADASELAKLMAIVNRNRRSQASFARPECLMVRTLDAQAALQNGTLSELGISGPTAVASDVFVHRLAPFSNLKVAA